MMRLVYFISLFPLLGVAVASRPHHMVNSAISQRPTQDSPSPDCNATCTAFAAVMNCHGVPHCGCSTRYLQAQSDCLLCETSVPQDAAVVQFLVDAEINQCHKEGIPIQFRLPLPQEAQDIVDEVDREGAYLRRQQRVFLALQIAGGHVGLVLLLALAIFSGRRVSRDPTFVNFCVTWIFSSVVYSLLLYRGTQGNTVINPLGFVSQEICLLQASLINGAQAMTACSTAALVTQLWMVIRAATHSDLSWGPKQRRWAKLTLLALPYVLFFSFAIPSVFFGITHMIIEDDSVQRGLPANFYCIVFDLKPFLRTLYGLTLGLLIVATLFDALIIVILYRHWSALRHVHINGISLSMLLRVMVFSVYRVVVAVAYGTILDMPPRFDFIRNAEGDALSVSSSVPVWVDQLQAAIPLVGFLVLGVNEDLLTTLKFWRKDRRQIGIINAEH